eukprot:3713243-Rhodomonas_salina.5
MPRLSTRLASHIDPPVSQLCDRKAFLLHTGACRLPIAGSSWGREDSAAGKNEDENEHEMAALRTTSD